MEKGYKRKGTPPPPPTKEKGDEQFLSNKRIMTRIQDYLVKEPELNLYTRS